jgi:ribosomal protein L11 methyltransferase
MWSILLHPDIEAVDALTAELWEEGTAGIVEEADGLRTFFAEENTAAMIARKYQAELRKEQNTAVPAFNDLEWEPVLAGTKFVIAPPWVPPAKYEGRFWLTVDPSMAFGSGRHESTQLSMEALERYLKPGMTVADIGCGSGILTAAAKLLGAGRLVSCDIHFDSLIQARHLIDTPLFAGSADAIESEFADVVLANISARVVDHIAADLRRIAKPNGLLILAGFIDENPPKCFEPREALRRGDWLCWICGPADVHAKVSADQNVHDEKWW